MVVILDHGKGWTTLLSGLQSVRVRAGARVGQGALIGQAPDGAQAAVTVELRRRDRAIDMVPLIG